MTKSDEILVAVKDVSSKVDLLSAKLYGEDGFEGDIPELKVSMRSHGKRLTRVELIIAGLIGSGALGGGIVGIAKWLGS